MNELIDLLEKSFEGIDARSKIAILEKKILEQPGSLKGDVFPLKHTFGEGVCMREISIPKGALVTGRIHRHTHPSFLLKGELICFTEQGGRVHLKAPMSIMTPAGAKRAALILEDTVWVDVFVTEETEIEKVVEEASVPDYETLEGQNMKILESA